jgi:hypothetical protein
METGGLPAIEIILLVLAANAVLILTAYGLVTWWRKQSQDTLRKIGEQIQAYAGQMDQLANFLNAYAGIDQEPFFTPLDELQKESSELEHRLQDFLSTCRNFEEELYQPQPNQFQAVINAPFTWFRRWRKAAELRRESREITGQMSAAEQRMETIYALPWELASECRLADRQVAELAEHAQWLQAHGARGITFQKILSQIPILQRGLDGIPPVFLEGSQEEVLAAASFDSTVRVFEVLNATRPAIDRYLPQLTEWRTILTKAAADYNLLKQTGANLRQALANPPAGLVITPLQERLDQVAQLAADLNQRLAQPEVEMLKPLAREISQLGRVLQDTEQQLARAGQQVTQLAPVLNELNHGVGRLSEQLTRLEHSESYPMVLDDSGPRLSGLRQHLQVIGPANQPRTPDQVFQHYREAGSLRAEYQALATAAPRLAEQHRALLILLDSPDLRDGATWLQAMRETLTKTNAYDPKNWTKQDGLQALPAELEELAILQERLVPADRVTPVNETELTARLKETQQLAARHKALRPRGESIRSRLEKLQVLEREGKEKLTGSWNTLERVALLAESNHLLDEAASAEIDQLSEEIRQLGNELNMHNQGEIEKKALKISTMVEKVTHSLNQWLSHLANAVIEQKARINERLILLNAIAGLDDPAVEEARSLVARGDISSPARGPASESSLGHNPVSRVAARITHTDSIKNLNELEALAEIKRQNDLWQTLSAAQKALDEKTAPLLAANQETTRARDESRRCLEEAFKVISEKPAWPPSNQSPLTESMLLKPVDEKWDALRQQRVSIERAIAEIGRLAQQYRLVDERGEQLLERVKQDQERVVELEEQVDGLKQRWQSQVEPGNPVMSAGVQQLISQTDSRLAFIKQQYMRGSLSYEQVIHNMQLLYDDLLSSRVPVDAQTEIGINEVR